jgi:hypothetical protein
MTPYQIFLLLVLILWPLAIMSLLFLMSRLESYLEKVDAETPEEAGLEPIEGSPPEKEVTIVFGDQVIGESGHRAPTGGRRTRPRPSLQAEGQRLPQSRGQEGRL